VGREERKKEGHVKLPLVLGKGEKDYVPQDLKKKRTITSITIKKEERDSTLLLSRGLVKSSLQITIF